MPEPLLPEAESLRLAALRQLELMGTPAEERFDRLTRLLRRIFDVPMAAVTLVDAERVWVKSLVGAAFQDLPRTQAMCTHTVEREEPLIVLDALSDPRFPHDPLGAAAGGPRFYAGFPVHSNGQRVGSLCVMDFEPRKVSEADLLALRDIAALVDAELEVVAISGQVLRVGERRLEEMSRLASFPEHSPSPVVELDLTEGVTYVNTAAARRFPGLSRAGWEHPILAGLVDEISRQIRRGELFAVREVEHDGYLFEQKICLLPHGGRARVYLADVTERRAVQHMKDEFLGVVGHELRTPLTGIRGALGLLAGGLAGPLPPEAEQLVAIASKSSERLSRLLDDLLDVQRLEAGSVAFHPCPLDLGVLAGEAAEGLREAAAQAGVQIGVEAVKAPVVGDARRLRQVFSSLLDNGVKFSNRGGQVRVTLARDGRDWVVTVTDSGKGVPKEKLESIFTPFGQVDNSDTREQGGAGLGLAICRGIVRQHGGRIWAEPDQADGAVFKFALPAVGS